ncbi:cytochrome b5-like protein [Propionicimonas paludicola]|uniref:Cytochrome b5-like protein n=1 Tax=Propionicimonas paludicola TaxID=185243 RepID=A0A2A9CMQ5_9ACTN|nr:cytochrome b5-like heme/steroid binding domain-containing protein [Propionicimonas paludicola]PFG15608.1 cytochrome b5-like protein [Propionicimonas paludicola]
MDYFFGMDLSQFLGGLPLHPLVVHFAVVLVPVAALGLLLLVLFSRLADRFGVLALLVLAVGTAAAFVAKESGEDLAAKIGRPAEHATWGALLPWVAAGLWVAALIWFLLHRADRRANRGRSGATIGGALLTAALALVTVALSILVGHSGATAVWAGTGAGTPSAKPSGTVTTPAAPPASPSSSAPAPSAEATYTASDLAAHASASSCWAAINGSVYDLTDWINAHPGGPQRILALCGTDATAAFNAQHSGQAQPADQLKQFRIGTFG